MNSSEDGRRLLVIRGRLLDRARFDLGSGTSSFFQEHGERLLSLSFDEVQDESLPAWNWRGEDRSYYDPKGGAVFFGDALDLPHTYPWPVARPEAVPREGWAHDDGCDCRSCQRPRTRPSAGPDDWRDGRSDLAP
jgi:hypothetical protein